MQNIGDVASAEVYTSKKLAMNIADEKNRLYVANGVYAYSDIGKRYIA